MALIDFPNVPISPGVPDLRRAVTGVAARTGLLGTLQSFDQFGILDKLLATTWGIYNDEGEPEIEFDAILSFQWRGEEKIATHPVERGDFASYNKVTVPFDIEMTATVNGQGESSKGLVISRLEDMKFSTDTYSVVTPDAAYQSANLVSFDYRRTSQSGVEMLTITMRFQEVRETASETLPPTAEPSGSSPVSQGTVKASSPTQQEAGVFNSEDFF